MTQPGPERLAALDAARASLVAGEDGEPQVGAEPLGRRADGRPARAAGRRACASGVPATGPEMVVLDAPARPGRVSTARSSRPGSASSAAPVGFWPRGVRTTARAPARMRGGQRVRQHAARRRRPPARAQAERATRSSTPGQPGSSTATASPGGEVGGEHALDAVERAVDHAQVPAGDAVGGERRAGDRRELGSAPARAPYSRAAPSSAAQRAERRRAAAPGPGCRSRGRARRSGTARARLEAAAPAGARPRACRCAAARRRRRAGAGRRTRPATVVGLTSSVGREARTEGSRAPGRQRPAAIAASTLAAIALADAPLMLVLCRHSQLNCTRTDARQTPRTKLRRAPRARAPRPRDDRRDPRRGAGLPPRLRPRRPAVRDPDAARARRRRGLHPRLGRQPRAAHARATASPPA